MMRDEDDVWEIYYQKNETIGALALSMTIGIKFSDYSKDIGVVRELTAPSSPAPCQHVIWKPNGGSSSLK